MVLEENRALTHPMKLQPEEIQECEVPISEFQRHPARIWEYLEVRGHVVIITVRRKRDAAIMSLETYAGFIDYPDEALKQMLEEIDRQKKEKECDATT